LSDHNFVIPVIVLWNSCTILAPLEGAATKWSVAFLVLFGWTQLGPLSSIMDLLRNEAVLVDALAKSGGYKRWHLPFQMSWFFRR
jgi:hypothetical protein